MSLQREIVDSGNNKNSHSYNRECGRGGFWRRYKLHASGFLNQSLVRLGMRTSWGQIILALPAEVFLALSSKTGVSNPSSPTWATCMAQSKM